MPRALATARTLAAPCVSVQNIPASLSFNGTSSKVVLTQNSGLPIYSTAGYSVAGWFKYAHNTYSCIYAEGNSGNLTPYFFIYLFGSYNNSIGVYVSNTSGSLLNAHSNTLISPNIWYHYAWIDNAGTTKLYVNGVPDSQNLNYTPSGTFGYNTSNIGSRTRTGNDYNFSGNISSTQLFNYALTPDQVKAVQNGDLKGNIGSYSLTEGSQSTTYDTSGNGNNGTITAGTYTADTPSSARALVGGNLVYNGNFSFIPPVNVAQTAAQTWIDGTSGGSATNSLFGWTSSISAGTMAFLFDTATIFANKPSLKVSCTNASGAGYATNKLGTANLIPVNPSTSYTLSARISTNNAAASSVGMFAAEYNGAKGYVGGAQTSMLSGTNGFTLVSKTFTTMSTARFLEIQCLNNVAGNVSDAWFNSVTLTPTVNTTRALAV